MNRDFFALALTLCLPVASHAKTQKAAQTRTPPSQIAVKTVNGNWIKPLQETKRKATVLLFIAHDCPISNSYAPELNRMIKQFSAQNVVFYLVYTEPELSPTAARTHLRQFGYSCSALFDRDLRLTKLVGATVTPEAAILAPDGTRRYPGCISDLKVGKEARYDARIIMNFKDAAGKQVDPKPPPPASRNDTKGWETRSEQFLVPAGAVTLEFMPSLFQVEQGTFDLDDISLQPIDPTPLLAAVRAGQEEDKRNFVTVEAPQPAKWPQPLHIVGRQVLNKTGKSVWLQGVNVPGLEFSRQGDHLLKSVQVSVHDWKANIIRLPVESSYWFGKDAKDGGTADGGTAYRALVDAAINIAANRGAYVLLDLHHYGAARTVDAAFWTSAAARYKNHPAVLFDLLNEPHDTSWEVWRNGGFVQDNGVSADEVALLSPSEKALNTKGYHAIGMQKLLNAVRATGAKNVVVAGGLDWAYDLSGIANGFALEDKTGNGIIYATHIYNWKTDWKNKVLVVADKYPILLGEVGADVKKMDWLPLDAQEDPSTWVPDVLGFIQKYKLNWTAWSFHPGTTPVLISDWNFTPTPFWGVFAKRALAGEQFPLKKLR